jgi:hypothetical protein
VRQQLRDRQQGLPATILHCPSQGPQGRQGPTAVGKDWLRRIGDPAAGERSRPDDLEMEIGSAMEEEMTLAARMHAAAASAGNAERRTQRRATAAAAAVQHPLPAARALRGAKADGRMKEPRGAAQEAHTEEGWWRARGSEQRGDGEGRTMMRDWPRTFCLQLSGQDDNFRLVDK